MTVIKPAQPYRGISDPERIITCRLCGWEARVAEMRQRGPECGQCGTYVCIYCGCSDERGCIHPSFPNGALTCEWTDQAVCSFCFNQFAEEQYLVVTGRANLIKPPVTIERPLLIAPV